MIAGVLLRSLGLALEVGVHLGGATASHLDHALADSGGWTRSLHNDISASFLKVQATVIPHGVDTDAYAPPANRAGGVRGSGLPGRYGDRMLRAVRAQKGSDVFVEAMCRLLPRYPDFTAVVSARSCRSKR